MKISEITEGVAGPKNCWPGHRKVGTQPGTGKNAGKRVNDCEKIKEEEQLDEVSPKGWEGTVKAMKKHKEIDNPWALAWYMKNKGYKSHKKESIDPDQRKAKQVPGEEMPKSTGPILGKEPKQHPFKGRAVGGGV